MGIKYKTVKNDFPKMEAGLKDLRNRTINVGYLDGGEQAWLAGIHEYGCRIKITDKMRGWLHANGLHVKDSTTEIVIPERSFLRTGFDENHEEVVRKAEKALSKALGNGNVEIVLDSIGQILRDKIADFATDLDSPANHPFTIERKGSSNPLVGGPPTSGDMINALTYEVK